MTLQGIDGEFCAPPCSATSLCPSAPADSKDVVGSCVVEDAGSGTPNACAMSCVAAGAKCPGNGKCIATSATGPAAKICTYLGKGPSPSPSPPPPHPPPPPPSKTLAGLWSYTESGTGQRDEYRITMDNQAAFDVAVVAGGHGWTTAHGTIDGGGSVSCHFDNGNTNDGNLNADYTLITWSDGTSWTKEGSSPPSPPPAHHDITGQWDYMDSGGQSHQYEVDQQSGGLFTANGDGHPWSSATGSVDSDGTVIINYDVTGTVSGHLGPGIHGADGIINWQDGTHWEKATAHAKSAANGVYNYSRRLLLANITARAVLVAQVVPAAAAASAVGGCLISSKGSTAHCAGKGKLNATIELGSQTNDSILLSIVVEDPGQPPYTSLLATGIRGGNSSTRSVTTLTIVSATPAPSPGGGAAACYTALGSICDSSRRQGVFQCATCAGSHSQPLHQAGCNQSQIQAWCSNATCMPILQQLCGAAKAAGVFQCASCVGAHSQTLNRTASCTAEQEQAWCTGAGPTPPPSPPSPPSPGQCVPCGSAATCCTPGLSPPQLCPGGSQCCSCKAASCACN